MTIGGLLFGGGVGCLVTDQVEFETERNAPPMIIDVPSPVVKINDTVWIDKSTRTMVSLPVRVRDENISEPLFARWRLVSKDDPLPMFDQKPVALTGEAVRDLAIELQTDPLHDGECARLDLVVSGSFIQREDPIYFDATVGEDDNDLDSVTWLIWEGAGPAQATDEDTRRLVASCPTNEKLVPPLTATPPMEATP